MKKTYFITLILLTSSFVFSQEINETQRMSIGVKYMAGQSWASGTMNEYYGSISPEIEIKTLFSSAFGAHFIYHFRYDLAVESGVFYNMPGFKSERERFIMYVGDTSHFGIVQAYRTTFVDFRNLYIPLKIRYTLPLRKFRFFASGGPAVNFILASEQRIRIEAEEGDLIEESTLEDLFVNDVFYSLNLSIGLDYRFSKSLIFSFEPGFHYGFTRIFEEVERDGLPSYQPEQKLRMAGVSLGIRYVVN